MTAVRLSAEALADLDDIWFYIARDSVLNADRFIDRLVATMADTLSAVPLAGRAREELGMGLRSLAFGEYLVFYRVRANNVEIVRVIHGRRDLGAVFDG